MSEAAAPPTTAPDARTPAWRLALDLAGVALVVLHLVVFVTRNLRLQWDARVYFDAARAVRAGLDPYLLESLALVDLARPHALPFLYPPVTLPLFLPFAALPRATALACWMALDVAAFAALVLLWKRLAPRVEWLPLVLVAVFGFDGAGLLAMRAGNVALLEALLVWAGLAAFVAGRRRGFAALVAAAACFKLAPAALLFLLLVPVAGARPRPALLAVSLATLALLVWAPSWFPPASGWSGFARHLGAPLPVGAINPSLSGLALAGAHRVARDGGAATALGFAIWGTAVGLVLAASLGWLRRAWRDGDARRWAFAAAWVWVLFQPRPMAYGYLAMAVAPLAFAPGPFKGPVGRLLLALVLAAQGLSRNANVVPDSLVVQHAPALLALALWLLVVRERPAPVPDAR